MYVNLSGREASWGAKPLGARSLLGRKASWGAKPLGARGKVSALRCKPFRRHEVHFVYEPNYKLLVIFLMVKQLR